MNGIRVVSAQQFDEVIKELGVLVWPITMSNEGAGRSTQTTDFAGRIRESFEDGCTDLSFGLYRRKRLT